MISYHHIINQLEVQNWVPLANSSRCMKRAFIIKEESSPVQLKDLKLKISTDMYRLRLLISFNHFIQARQLFSWLQPRNQIHLFKPLVGCVVFHSNIEALDLTQPFHSRFNNYMHDAIQQQTSSFQKTFPKEQLPDAPINNKNNC